MTDLEPGGKPTASPTIGTATDAVHAVSGRGLFAKTSIVSGMTLVSRILGLIRDIVLARYFGAGLVIDAFVVANRIPNMLRRFFGEGAFSAGFVPVMARYRERHTHADTREFIDAIAGTFSLVLFVITLAGVVLAPILVIVVAPGFIGDGGDLDLATMMLRFTFPYLLFVSLTAFAGGILNTYGRFAVPAFTPVILNVVLIAGAVWWSPQLEVPGMALAYAVFVAGILQLLFQLPYLARIHALPRPRWLPRHEGVKRAMKLMLPAIFGSSVAQVNVLLSGMIASLLGVGSISYLYFSDRMMEFPLGLFGIALATVTLPYLSRLWSNDMHEAFSQTLDWSMRIALLIATPACLGLLVLSEPLIATLFYGGIFDANAVHMTALALQAYAVGLLGFSFVKILAPAFFAREDTRTPVRIGIVSLVVNAVLSVIFAWYLTRIDYAGPHVGLALATSVAACVNALMLYHGLHKSGVLRHSAGWPALLLQVGTACAAMCVVLVLMAEPLAWWLDQGFSRRGVNLAIAIVAGGGTYVAVLLVTGLRPASLGLRR